MAEASCERAEPHQFAHRSEAEIARLLDFYHLRWEYEPSAFPLEWDSAGKPTRLFTPDFYLPDLELFIEVTTLKPSLASRKNRKLRRFRELYPELRIKLFSLRDIEALLTKYDRRGALVTFSNETDERKPERTSVTL